MEEPGAQRTDCGLPRRGYRAATPPATLEPEAQRLPRFTRASAKGCTPASRPGRSRQRGSASAIVTALPTRRRKAARPERQRR